MSNHSHSMRLDQILIKNGLVSDDQIKEALECQKEHGGKLGSHLLRFGYVDEAGLVGALAQQYDCEGVVLSELDIPDIIVKFIPTKIAVARRVMPFDYNPEENMLLVACADPSDSYLIDELNFVARGKRVRLFIAVEQSLKDAIEKYYDIKLKLTGETPLAQSSGTPVQEVEIKVFSVPEEELADIEETPAVSETLAENHANLLIQNLDLFVMMLGFKGEITNNRSMHVGRFADRLCQALKVTAYHRAIITSAAYLHDLARYYYEAVGVPEFPRTVCDLTIKLLKSLNYSEEVIAILDKMYAPLPDSESSDVDLAVLGGSIITAVAEMIDMLPTVDKITSDRFEQLASQLRVVAGMNILPEVVEALLELIQIEMLAGRQDDRFSHVLILGDNLSEVDQVQKRLKEADYHPAAESSLEAFVALYQRGLPDMMVLLGSTAYERTETLVDRLLERGVNLHSVPTFVLTDTSASPEPGALLEKGIEDIVPLGSNLDLLVAKMNRIRSRKNRDRDQATAEAPPTAQQGVTQGNLKDMNLIDLLQALGISRKTTRLTVVSVDDRLDLQVRDGNVVYARTNCEAGVEAVYKGMSWQEGSWTMRPIDPDNMPESNIADSYEKILMEGCRLLDESQRRAENQPVR